MDKRTVVFKTGCFAKRKIKARGIWSRLTAALCMRKLDYGVWESGTGRKHGSRAHTCKRLECP